jgi:hypothetical protein
VGAGGAATGEVAQHVMRASEYPSGAPDLIWYGHLRRAARLVPQQRERALRLFHPPASGVTGSTRYGHRVVVGTALVL